MFLLIILLAYSRIWYNKLYIIPCVHDMKYRLIFLQDDHGLMWGFQEVIGKSWYTFSEKFQICNSPCTRMHNTTKFFLINSILFVFCGSKYSIVFYNYKIGKVTVWLNLMFLSNLLGDHWSVILAKTCQTFVYYTD